VHRVSGRVDAKDQVARGSARPSEDRSTVAGPDIDDHPVGPGDLLVDLADVDVDDPAADDLTHRRSLHSVGERAHRSLRA
jgi:hypothetical protein